MIPTVHATRIVAPLWHASSMPMLVEADDGARYVMKMHGAGQGAAALVAEVVIAALAEVVGLRVPRRVLVTLDGATASEHRHDEVVDLVARSQGLNLGFAFLEGAVAYDPQRHRVAAPFARLLVGFDTFVWNVDRTAKNPNLLVDDETRDPICIDHGASPLFFQPADALVVSPAASVAARHVLSPFTAGPPDAVAARFTPDALAAAVAQVPAAWLPDPAGLLATLRRRAATL